MSGTLKHIIKTGLAVVLLTITTMVVLAGSIPSLRAMSEYSVHMMLLLLLLSMAMLIVNQKRLMFAGLICTGILALYLKSASNSSMKLAATNEEEKISVAHFNLSNMTASFQEMDSILEASEVDIISFQELTPDWHDEIRTHFSFHYPYQMYEVRIDPFGMAIYSRYPYEKADTFQYQGIPQMKVEVNKKGTKFSLFTSYLVPAFDRSSIQKAGQQLKVLSNKIKETDIPTIALGAYNMVYWSNEMRNFKFENDFENSRRDLTQGNLRVPYDHIFYSKELECIRFKEIRDKNQSFIGITGTYQLKSDLEKNM